MQTVPPLHSNNRRFLLGYNERRGYTDTLCFRLMSQCEPIRDKQQQGPCLRAGKNSGLFLSLKLMDVMQNDGNGNGLKKEVGRVAFAAGIVVALVSIMDKSVLWCSYF